MDWRTYYKEHTMTPEQAVSVIHDGDRVVFGHAVGEPIIFQRTMARMAEQFHNVEVAHMVYLGSGEYLQPGMESHFRHNALCVGGPARKPIAEHRADYTPVFFSDVPRMFRRWTFSRSPARLRTSAATFRSACRAITAHRRSNLRKPLSLR